MRLTRVHLAPPLVAGEHRQLTPAAAAHLTRVLRLPAGTEIRLFDGAGTECGARILTTRGGKVEVALEAPLVLEPAPRLALKLLQGISRGERMDYTVQKATELGVAAIQPLLTERAVVKLDEARAKTRLLHWRGIAIAACEQCERARAPAIDSPVDYREYLAGLPPSPPGVLRLLLSPTGAGGFRADARPCAVEILVGPEGGLTGEEEALAGARGFAPVRLGPRILRTETAALAALAALQTLYGDFAP
jgi:16S rRNA (uracil1498-N3)-methyltransferase